MSTVVARRPPPEASPVLAKAKDENFPVALRLLPREHRRHLMAIYGFARLVDDTGDELEGGPQARLEALDDLAAELDRAFAGTATHPVFRALAPTIAELRLDRRPFDDLIEANRVDQRVSHYETFDELLAYCQLSANSVGRLVLAVFRQDSPENARLSDLVCTALQVVEHLQDVREDAQRGRVYLPAEEMRSFGVDPAVLSSGDASPAELRRLVAYETARAHAFLGEGAALVGRLRGWPAKAAIAGYIGGGLAQVDAIGQAEYDVLGRAPKASSAQVAAHVARLLGPRRKRGGGFRGPGPAGRAD
jgi:squalene synthase HpnC